MAADWTKMRDDLPDDPAVITIAALTGLDVFSVVGRLQQVWSWAGRHTLTGRVAIATPDMIDGIAGAQGFFNGMQKVDWVRVDADGCILFPRWSRHNSKAAKRRALEQRRMAAKRSHQCEQNANKNRTRVEESRGENKRGKKSRNRPPRLRAYGGGGGVGETPQFDPEPKP